jgi:uncharacterized membrane protein
VVVAVLVVVSVVVLVVLVPMIMLLCLHGSLCRALDSLWCSTMDQSEFQAIFLLYEIVFSCTLCTVPGVIYLHAIDLKDSLKLEHPSDLA